jgi:hypothetical protein
MKVYIAYAAYFSHLGSGPFAPAIWKHREVGVFASAPLAERYAKEAFAAHYASLDKVPGYRLSEEGFDKHRRWYIEEKSVISE